MRDALAGTSMLPAGSAAAPASQPAATATAPTGGLNTTEIREWARAQGIEVKDRGRVPADLVARFKAATGQQGRDIHVREGF